MPLVCDFKSERNLLTLLILFVLRVVWPKPMAKMTPFWDAAPCSLVEVDRRFRGAYCLHHSGDDTTRRYVAESCHLHTRCCHRMTRVCTNVKLQFPKHLPV
jgi:hypothetical protein